MQPAEVLALVEDQFAHVRKEFYLQMQRTAQLQVQLDRIQSRTNDACSTLDSVYALIKRLVKAE